MRSWNWFLYVMLGVWNLAQKIDPFAPGFGGQVDSFKQWMNAAASFAGGAFQDADGHLWTTDGQGLLYDNGNYTGYWVSSDGVSLYVGSQ